jgi:predicted PurR-regulated permease PerM
LVLSKFAGAGWFNKLQSFIARLVMSFHPIVYIYFLYKWLQHPQLVNILIFNISIVLLLMLAGWTFIISQRFQRPILFDKRTEEERLDNLTKLTQAVEAQTSVVEDLVDLLKPEEDITSEDKEGEKNSSPSQ